jgi:hypothetical protein
MARVVEALPPETRVEVHGFAVGGHLLPIELPAEVARAIDDFLAREGAGIDAYVDELNERTPFRQS